MNLQVLRLHFESKNHILAISMRLCISNYQHYPKNNSYKNPKFDIRHLHQMLMLFETFYENRTNTMVVHAYKRIRTHYGLWTKILVNAF